MNDQLSRRDLLAGAGSLAVTGALSALSPPALSATSGCVAGTALGRLKSFLGNATGTSPIATLNVVQGAINSADPVKAGSVIYPAPAGYGVNPNPQNLANLSRVWGYRRDTWTAQPSLYFGSLGGNGSWFSPMSRQHMAATSGNNIPPALHFIHTGQGFEVLFAGRYAQVTLVVDGQYCTARAIETEYANGTPGALLGQYSTFTRFDFGSVATRRISVYGFSTLGPCAIAIGQGESITPWDRSAEPSFCAMTDSYGQGSSNNWSLGGPFFVAASLLGIPHVDLNAIGGTGYAPTGSPLGIVPGNAFPARLPDSVNAAPDLFLTAGSINDDYNYPQPGLYATPAAALAAFTNGVNRYYQALRASLPNAVLAAMGPWAPVQSIPTSPVAQGKMDIIHQALAAVGGPWVMIDNLNGGWTNSAGASGPALGPWQTGTGNVGVPRGDGNGDIYVSQDGTHPTVAGNMYLGHMLASSLAAGILAL